MFSEKGAMLIGKNNACSLNCVLPFFAFAVGPTFGALVMFNLVLWFCVSWHSGDVPERAAQDAGGCWGSQHSTG
jgi:hypothetical protein